MTPETRGKLSAAAWTASPCTASLRSRTERFSPPRRRAFTAVPTTPSAGARSTGTRESRTASHDDERLRHRGRDAVAVRRVVRRPPTSRSGRDQEALRRPGGRHLLLG